MEEALKIIFFVILGITNGIALSVLGLLGKSVKNNPVYYSSLGYIKPNDPKCLRIVFGVFRVLTKPWSLRRQLDDLERRWATSYSCLEHEILDGKYDDPEYTIETRYFTELPNEEVEYRIVKKNDKIIRSIKCPGQDKETCGFRWALRKSDGEVIISDAPFEYVKDRKGVYSWEENEDSFCFEANEKELPELLCSDGPRQVRIILFEDYDSI